MGYEDPAIGISKVLLVLYEEVAGFIEIFRVFQDHELSVAYAVLIYILSQVDHLILVSMDHENALDGRYLSKHLLHLTEGV